MEEGKTLLEEMDAAARELLKLIMPPEELAEGEDPLMRQPPPSLPEKVKLFDTLIDYIKWREQPVTSTVADKPARSKFQLLKGEFNDGRSDKAKGGRGRGDPTPTPTASSDEG